MSTTNLSFSLLFSNLIGLFSLIGVGFLLVRVNLIPASASGSMTALLMKVTLPASIFSSMIRPFDMGFFRDAVVIFFIGFGFFLGYAGLSWLLSRLFRVPKGRRGMWMECCTFCNNGFMGFPVAYAIFGDEGLALAVILGISFNLLIYTLGAKMVALDQPEGGQAPQVSWSKVMFSVINFTIVLSLLFYCFQIPVPAAVFTPIQHLANVTTPLSMLITGMNLAESRLSDVIFDRDAITASFVRLLVFPILTWALLRLLPVSNPLVLGVTLIIMSMPSAAVSVAMGEQYNGCTELGARAVFLSSLLCIVTIPMISLLL
ncbi:MAG: AEC family transporter [Lawsonibacter sp.]